MAANQSYSESLVLPGGALDKALNRSGQLGQELLPDNRMLKPEDSKSRSPRCMFCHRTFLTVRSRNIHTFKNHHASLMRHIRIESNSYKGSRELKNILVAKTENKSAKVKEDVDSPAQVLDASMESQPAADVATKVPKKRGRKRLPRDENGKIIRDAAWKGKSRRLAPGKASRRGLKRKSTKAIVERMSKRAKMSERQNNVTRVIKDEPQETLEPVAQSLAASAPKTEHNASKSGSQTAKLARKRVFTCSTCFEPFQKAIDLAEHHKNEHTGKFNSKEIKKDVRAKARLKKATRIRRNKKEKPALAEDCQKGADFSPESCQIRFSIAFVVLDKIEIHDCKICSRIFVSGDKLQSHVKFDHSN